MTTAYSEQSLSKVAADALGGATGGIGRIRRAWTDYLLYRRALAEMKALSARELADLDLAAADLPALAWTAVKGR
ncbi:DUF1127 domain-containing protein [uncultured Amaricoccus sp.]|uniref:DUF1127 domain-containing protein n=1 Tax=uncultured Amaricoccus sp. TaxID=339341 RepID=UPI00261994F7|nr:DUF1127 domain-containing protein [uncultured Amaricoccus sp.]